MRDPIENISQLQKKLNDLQLENQILKNILDKAGLSYHKELSEFRQNDCKEAYDLEQGKKNYLSADNNRKYGKPVFWHVLGQTGCLCKA